MSDLWNRQDEGHWDGFACSCSDGGKKKIAEMRAEVDEFLNHPGPEKFLTTVVYKLEHEFGGAGITSLAADMWALVIAEKRDWSAKDHPVVFSVRAQCDALEDGVAMVMQAFMKRYPRENSEGEAGSPGEAPGTD